MVLIILMLASSALALLVARWLYLGRRFARPEVPGGDLVRVVGRLRTPGAVEVAGEAAPPFELLLSGPIEVETRDGPVRVLTQNAVLDTGWWARRGQDLRPGQQLTVDGAWTTVPRDGLYREAGRQAALDAVRVVAGARPGLLRMALPVLLVGAAAVASLGLVDPLPSRMRASAEALRCPAGARRVSVTYTGDRGWAHACTRPDGTLHGPWASYYRDGRPWRGAVYHHGKLHGTEREWFPTGTPRTRTDYRHSRRHGVTRVWRQDGRLKVERRYRNGRRRGELRLLTSNPPPNDLTGSIMGTAIYIQGWREVRP